MRRDVTALQPQPQAGHLAIGAAVEDDLELRPDRFEVAFAGRAQLQAGWHGLIELQPLALASDRDLCHSPAW